MKGLKRYIDAIVFSSLQTKLSVCSFLVGSAMCLLCMFWVPPPGEVTSSALQATGMFLVLAGAAAGINVAFDLQSQKFNAQLADVMKRLPKKKEEEDGVSDELF